MKTPELDIKVALEVYAAARIGLGRLKYRYNDELLEQYAPAIAQFRDYIYAIQERSGEGLLRAGEPQDGQGQGEGTGRVQEDDGQAAQEGKVAHPFGGPRELKGICMLRDAGKESSD